MITGRPKPDLTLAADEQTQLRSLTASRTLPHALVARAKVVLWSAQGQSNTQIARRLHWRNDYPPTYSSWLNQVERWFGLITQRAIRRGSFTSVQDLVRKIDAFVEHYNRSSRPFVWTATADSILQKIGRLCSRIFGTRH
jgi:transposase